MCSSFLLRIITEKPIIEKQRGDAPVLRDLAQDDYEIWPHYYFANPSTDLLKFVYFFAAAMELQAGLQNSDLPKPILQYAICIWL